MMIHKIRKSLTFASIVVPLVWTSCTNNLTERRSLKDALSGKFYIGTAMDSAQIIGTDTSSIHIIQHHFNAITAENCMKSEVIQPFEGAFNFELADQFVDFGIQNHMKIIGHVLIWHSQAPQWFFSDSLGNEVSRELLIERMKNHISTVVGRYKGKVNGWDVVNEAIQDDGSWRPTKFFNIIGPEYVKLAFQFAHEADPDAELYYNDYSMAHQGRRNGVVQMIKDLQNQGIKVDGIGMQAHISLDFPPVSEFEKSLVAFSELGVKVMITEMDMTVLPAPDPNVGADVAASYEYEQSLNPYASGLTDSIHQLFTKRYFDFFRLFLKHHEKIDRVTIWGVNDQQSWRNYWPIFQRVDYPLLFDRQNQPKPIVDSIIRETLIIQ